MSDHQVSAPSADGVAATPGLLEAVARAVLAALTPPQPALSSAEDVPDFLTPNQLAARLGVSSETVRRLAVANVLPHTVVCRGKKKTTRRFPARFVDDFAASGLDVADLAEFTARWRADHRMESSRDVPHRLGDQVA